MNTITTTKKPSAFRMRLIRTGDFVMFAARFFREVFRRPVEWKEIVWECYKAGNKTLPLVAITAFIMGMVLTIQSRPSLVEFGAASLLPGMVSVSLVREIAPVITAVICAGKIGSRLGAELGAMRVTEQIDAMEVSAINPYKFLVVSRTLACTLMVPLLIIFTDAIGMFGSYIAMNIHDEISLQRFFAEGMSHLEFIDVVPALVKSVFFGFAIGIIGCYQGYHAKGGTESVGAAATTAVVSSSLAIFFIDMLAVQITDLL